MTISTRKIAAFAKLITGLADHPSLGSTTLLKQWFDSSPEELRLALNGLIDDLTSTTTGSSGSENIGSAAISGVSGLTTYAQLVDLKSQLSSAVFGALTTDTKSALLQKIGIINGNFDIWQRGTSFTNPASGTYAPDRYKLGYDGSGQASAVSQQAFTIGQVAVPNEPKYFCRYQVTTAATGQTFNTIQQQIESVRVFAGQKCTISFWAKADAVRTIGVTLRQLFGSGGSPSASVDTSSSNFSLSTSWQKFTYTFTLPSISGKTLGTNSDSSLGALFFLPVNAIMTIDIAQIMLNAGDAALPFQPKSIADELVLCQRYYEKSYDIVVAPGANAISGMGNIGFPLDANTLQGSKFVARKRTIPTVTIYSQTGTINRATVSGGSNTTNAATASSIGETGFLTVGSTALVTTNFYYYHFTADAEI